MKPDMNNIFLISFLPCWDKKLIICAETGVSVNRSAFSEFVNFYFEQNFTEPREVILFTDLTIDIFIVTSMENKR